MSKNRKIRNFKRAEAERLQRRYDTFMTGLALCILTVTPILFRIIRIDFVSPAITNTTSADTGTVNDTFTYIKMVIYYIGTAFLAAVFAIRLLTTEYGGFRLTRYDAALAALCAFLVVSCLLSDYKSIAINGYTNMLDGTVIHICYCALFFFGFHVFSKSVLSERFYLPLFVCGAVNALISTMNFLGVNMIDTAIVKTILGVPANAVANNARAFTSTFGNVNYLSGFGAVLFAVFFTRLMFSRPAFRAVAPRDAAQRAAAPQDAALNRFAWVAGRVDWRVLLQNALSFIMAAAAFAVIVTSVSSSGFFTFLVMAPVILIFAALRGLTVRKIALAASSLAVCAVLLFAFASVNAEVYDETFGLFRSFASNTMSDSNAPPLAYMAYHDMRIDDAGMARLVNDNANDTLTPVMARLGNRALRINNAASAANATNAAYADAPPAAQYPTEFALPEYFPEPGVTAGTGRIYIWKNALSLLAKRPLIGYGMDTLSYTFPQNDLNKVAELGSYAYFVTKPHNIFVGYAYGAGIPALLAFLAFNVLMAAAFLRYFFKKKPATANSAADLLIMCAFMGWAAYLVQGLFNDDLISTAPLWWALAGVGLGLIRNANENLSNS